MEQFSVIFVEINNYFLDKLINNHEMTTNIVFTKLVTKFKYHHLPNEILLIHISSGNLS